MDVDAVLGGMGRGDVLDHRAVGAVHADADLLQRVGRAAQLRLRVLGEVDHHVLGLRARALDLDVAADAGALVRDAPAVLTRRERNRLVRERASLEVDQVLVVRAVHLVPVGRGALTVVRLLLVLRALRVVRRLRARLRLEVLAGHDHDAVVVARLLDRRLDALELAAAVEGAVEPLELACLPGRELLGPLRGAQDGALLARGVDRADRLPQRRPLADHARLPARLCAQRRGEAAGLRDLAASRGLHALVGRRVRPVGAALHVAEGGCRGDRHGEGDRGEQGEQASGVHRAADPTWTRCSPAPLPPWRSGRGRASSSRSRGRPSGRTRSSPGRRRARRRCRA